jgi:cysteine desulfurase
MMPYWTTEFGNPHASHAFGERAAFAVSEARQKIARILGGKTTEWIFTSGATEANVLAICGVMHAAPQNKKHLIVCATEHKSVLETCKSLVRRGYVLTILPVNQDGSLSLDLLKQSIRPETMLVSIMVANNEIGVILPIACVAEICHKHGVLLHTDATQAIGNIPVSVSSLGADLISFSGHKIYGPKGIGALYVASHVKIRPLLYGGLQEKGLRAGTVPVPLCIGLAKALEIAEEMRPQEARRLAFLQGIFLQRLQRLKGWRLNGCPNQRLPNNVNISIDGVDSSDLLMSLPDFALSTGSACSSEAHFSHVLAALDPDNIMPPTVLRISFGRGTTEAAVYRLADRLIEVVQTLRITKPAGGKRICKTTKGKIRS